MNRRIIFLGGVHGVGKSSFSRSICSKFNVKSISASELIKWSEINPDPFDKKVIDITSTQDKLLHAIDATCTENVTYLLVGHFCLLNSENVPTKVPEVVFNEMKPELILLLTAPADIIKKRLGKRDKITYDLKLLEKLQREETLYAQYISEKLECKLLKFASNNTNPIEKYLKSIL